MAISFRKITLDNLDECLDLRTTKDQKKFVASNIYSLAEAYVLLTNPGSIPLPFAIYNEGKIVGFIMLIYEKAAENKPDDEDVYVICRLLIDKEYQGKGYGKQAVAKALELIRTFPYGKTRLAMLSYDADNIVAKNLYASFGFKETGEIVYDELLAVLEL